MDLKGKRDPLETKGRLENKVHRVFKVFLVLWDREGHKDPKAHLGKMD